MKFKEYQKSLEEIFAIDLKGKASPAEKGDALADAVKLLFGDLKHLELIEEKKRREPIRANLT